MAFIPYPCPKPLEDMKSTKKGFYCNDCGHTLIDLRSENATLPPKGSCVVSYEEVEDEKSAEINKSYRFALALFIVMGSSMILNNTIEAKNILTTIETIKSDLAQIDSNFIRFRISYSDENGQPIKPVKVIVTLANGKTIKPTQNKRYGMTVELPIHQIGKSITIQYKYYNETKSQTILIEKDTQSIPKIQFSKNEKDRYKKKDYLYKHKTGRFL
jgi:hypothetical protein